MHVHYLPVSSIGLTLPYPLATCLSLHGQRDDFSLSPQHLTCPFSADDLHSCLMDLVYNLLVPSNLLLLSSSLAGASCYSWSERRSHNFVPSRLTSESACDSEAQLALRTRSPYDTEDC